MRHQKIPVIALFFFFAILGATSSSAGDFTGIQIAGSRSHLLPENEREHLRARDRRERSEERSGAQFGYPNVFQNAPDRTIDYYLLSHQIARLGALIEALESKKSANLKGSEGFIPTPPPVIPLSPSLKGVPGFQGDANGASIYGTEGPNSKSVRLLLEYNLMVASNPRLKIGKIEENEESILAEIVTLEGSLVEKYSIDRKTGLWQVIR